MPDLSQNSTFIDSLKEQLSDDNSKLEAIEQRLGTDSEQSDDLERAREIAHRISNLQMLMSIRESLDLKHQTNSQGIGA